MCLLKQREKKNEIQPNFFIPFFQIFIFKICKYFIFNKNNKNKYEKKNSLL